MANSLAKHASSYGIYTFMLPNAPELLTSVLSLA